MQKKDETQASKVLKELELYKKDNSIAKPLSQSMREFSAWLTTQGK